MTTVAALFVEADGAYASVPDVDLWHEARDARLYDGPHPVVAHPPCARWGRFWWADGSIEPGNDDGCFAAALRSVRRWGGVIEHPEGSHAWKVYELPEARLGAWNRSLLCGGYSTAVVQKNYGHRARKLTWLYYHGATAPPILDWSDPGSDQYYLKAPGRCKGDRPRRRCPCERCRQFFGKQWLGGREWKLITKRERIATPPEFRDLLLAMAKESGGTR